MPWLNRDDPLDVISGQSAARKWDGEDWVEPGIGGRSIAIFHDDQQVSWTSPDNNGYWGPSVHWNRDLQEFVVLMSRSVGGNYKSGGIYMTHTARLDRPSSWTFPQLIIKDNQGWYPQVIGERRIEGTDKVSGARARYFNQGRSDSFIVFTKQSEPGLGRVTSPRRVGRDSPPRLYNVTTHSTGTAAPAGDSAGVSDQIGRWSRWSCSRMSIWPSAWGLSTGLGGR